MVSEVDGLRDELVALTRELVATNTVNPYSGEEDSPGEKAGQLILEQKFRELRLEPHLFEPREGIFGRFGIMGPSGRKYEGRPNLVVTVEYGEGATVIVNSHMDTVGITGMTIEPFSAKLEDGKIYGRGSSDSKGNLALCYIAIKALLRSGGKLKGRVVFESVVDEECSGCGAGSLACIEEGYRGEYGIFVDGSSLDITVGCYGCCTSRCEVSGLSGHASYSKGVSALDKAIQIKKAIDRWANRRTKTDERARTNIGIFRAGVQPSVVPARAEIYTNITYSLREAGKKMTGERIMRRFERAIKGACEKDEWLSEHPARVEWVKDLCPFVISEDTKLVQELRRAYRETLREEPRVVVMQGWNDASWFHRFTGAETVLFAGGSPGTAHSSVEYVYVEELVRGAKVLGVVLSRLLSA